MRFSRDAVEQYMNMKRMEQVFEEDRKRLQTGYRVFVSYSSVDEAIARQICSILSNEGIEHFFDRKDIHWGQEVTKGVSTGLQACTHLIVVVSPASLKSNWVAFEIGQAAALGKVILPFLLHPALDVPEFIRQYHYKLQVSEIREFFQTPAIDPTEIEKLYKIVMSRLPTDLEDYSYCAEESTPERHVWRSKSAMHARGDPEVLHGRIVLTGCGVGTKVAVDAYRAQVGNEARWHDFHNISYAESENSIVAEDQCLILEWDGNTRQSDHNWAASPAFWKGIVDLLYARLPSKAGGVAFGA
jgi:hypothetical protein